MSMRKYNFQDGDYEEEKEVSEADELDKLSQGQIELDHHFKQMEVLEHIPTDEEDHRNRATPSPKQDNFFAIGSNFRMSPEE